MGKDRPDFIRHYSELPSTISQYPEDDEGFGISTLLSRTLGLTRLGIYHECLRPGERSSWPHAEEREEEFVFVLSGTPDAWINGDLHRLGAGDCVAFVPGTGICHCLINNSDADVQLLVIGEKDAANRIFYAGREGGYHGMKPERWWSDCPPQKMGGHNGLPDNPRSTPSGE